MTVRIVLRHRRALRRVAITGLVAGLTMLGLAAVPAVASAAPAEQSSDGAARFAWFEDATITPGVMISSPLGNCTSSFVFTDGDDVFLSSAAHCGVTEDAGRSLNGCVEPVFPVGTELTIVGTDGTRTAGTLAYSSWGAMQSNEETDPTLCNFNDFALVELDPADIDIVNSSVPVFGGPTRLDTDGTESGEDVFTYQPNRHPGAAAKQGIGMGQPDGPWSHRVATTPPSEEGGSGAGYLDAGGEAFGLLSFGFEQGTPSAGIDGVTDIALAVDYAIDNGDLGKIALVPGTVAFSTDGVQSSLLPELLPVELPVRLTPVPL
ncbi:MAG: serine protease [Pseudonocardia sp.]